MSSVALFNLILLNAISLQTVPQGTDAPTQVRLSYGADPLREMKVMWQTAKPTASRVVHYGKTEAMEEMAVGHRPTYAHETGALAEVELTNLQPGTKYFYKVGDQVGGWSKMFTFRTAQSNPKSFTFTAYGDHGVTKEAAINVQNVLKENPAFHLLLGDISYANGDQPIWDRYLDQVEPMTSTIPYMIALGNHENERIKVGEKEVRIGYESTTARFAMPGFESWYTFDYGKARFISINSDDYRDLVQLEWFEKQLALARRNRNVEWLIVMNHHPAYGTSKGRGNNEGIIKTFVPLFDKYRVDLVLSGHDHHYERQFPLRAGKITSKDRSKYVKGDGTLYLVQGGGGRSSYEFTDPQPEMCAYREMTNGYTKVTVHRGGPLLIESKRLDGSLVEKIGILPKR